MDFSSSSQFPQQVAPAPGLRFPGGGLRRCSTGAWPPATAGPQGAHWGLCDRTYLAVLDERGDLAVGIAAMEICERLDGHSLAIGAEEAIREAPLVIADANFPAEATSALAELCRRHGVPLWVDPTAAAERILVLTDVKKKHSAHAITADVDLAETARAAAFFRSDGVIVTGVATGCAADVADLRAVQAAVSIPVLVGSGITADNLEAYWDAADAFIVGSHFKGDGRWDQTVDAVRVDRFMARVAALRRRS